MNPQICHNSTEFDVELRPGSDFAESTWMVTDAEDPQVLDGMPASRACLRGKRTELI